MSKKRILIIGSSNLDFVMNMYKLPEAGETIVDNGGAAYTYCCSINLCLFIF